MKSSEDVKYVYFIPSACLRFFTFVWVRNGAGDRPLESEQEFMVPTGVYDPLDPILAFASGVPAERGERRRCRTV